MKNTMNIMTKVFVFLIFATLTACGGGSGGGIPGGGSDATATLTPVGKTVSMTSYKGMNQGTAILPGTSIGFDLSGSDNKGGNYTGSLTAIYDGATTFEGQNVNKTRTLMTLTQTNAGVTATDTLTRYFLVSTGALYKESSSQSGRTSVSITSGTGIPDTVKVGDSGTYWTISSNDGSTSSSTWRLDPDYNGGSKLVVSSTTTKGNVFASSEDDLFYLNSDGTIVKIDFKITLANGYVMNLYGTRK